MSLNPYQKTSLTVALRTLERALQTVRGARGNGQTLHQIIDDLTDVQRGHLTAMAVAAQDVLLRLVRRFELEPDEMTQSQILRGQLATAWTALEDVQPAKLRRYGPVDPALDLTLRPDLSTLIDLVLAMQRVVDQTPARPRA